MAEKALYRQSLALKNHITNSKNKKKWNDQKYRTRELAGLIKSKYRMSSSLFGWDSNFGEEVVRNRALGEQTKRHC